MYKSLLITIMSISFLPLFGQELNSFEPLGEHEIITYSHGAKLSQITLYAKNILNDKRREIGCWENVPNGHAPQYAKDDKTCFMLRATGFSEINNSGSLSQRYIVQFVDGRNGIIEDITEIYLPYRVSIDGKYILNVEKESDNQTVYLKLTETITKEAVYLSWMINDPLYPGGFSVLKTKTGGFKILGTHEGGYVSAIANLNPYTKRLTVEMDLDLQTAISSDYAHIDDYLFYEYDVWTCDRVE